MLAKGVSPDLGDMKGGIETGRREHEWRGQSHILFDPGTPSVELLQQPPRCVLLLGQPPTTLSPRPPLRAATPPPAPAPPLTGAAPPPPAASRRTPQIWEREKKGHGQGEERRQGLTSAWGLAR